jgi:hypothetical protein
MDPEVVAYPHPEVLMCSVLLFNLLEIIETADIKSPPLSTVMLFASVEIIIVLFLGT